VAGSGVDEENSPALEPATWEKRGESVRYGEKLAGARGGRGRLGQELGGK
jgi:hypothetical protein